MKNSMDDADLARRRGAKVGHRKSRNGCSKCKTRRVKCDEVRPICSNCHRLGLSCSWTEPTALSGGIAGAVINNQISNQIGNGSGGVDVNQFTAVALGDSIYTPVVSRGTVTTGVASSLSDFSAATSAALGVVPIAPSVDSVDESTRFSALLRQWSRQEGDEDVFNVSDELADGYQLPESRSRRMLEHRLMLNYHVNLSTPFLLSSSPEWRELWSRQLPAMALQYDNVLYALLAQSATYMVGEGHSHSPTESHDRLYTLLPDRKELFRLRQAYLIAAMREQRRIINRLTIESAEAVCLSSLLMIVNAFAMLRERVLEPYTPPIEWLQLGRGSGAVIWLSVSSMVGVGDAAASHSIMFTLANAQPRFGFDDSYFDPSNRDQLNQLLNPANPPNTIDDLNDSSTRETYEKALAYVGSIQKAIVRGEPIYVLCRRAQSFAMVVPPRFVDFVAERRPRALVVLAHFFASVAQISGVWWLGDANGAGQNSIARRELRGIRSVLPPEWMGHMMWPLDTTGIS